MRSFWYGDRIEDHGGMSFHYRNEEYLEQVFSKCFDLLRMERYGEIEDDDSLRILARRKPSA